MSLWCTVVCLKNVYNCAFDFYQVQQFSEILKSCLLAYNLQSDLNKSFHFLLDCYLNSSCQDWGSWQWKGEKWFDPGSNWKKRADNDQAIAPAPLLSNATLFLSTLLLSLILYAVVTHSTWVGKGRWGAPKNLLLLPFFVFFSKGYLFGWPGLGHVTWDVQSSLRCTGSLVAAWELLVEAGGAWGRPCCLSSYSVHDPANSQFLNQEP